MYHQNSNFNISRRAILLLVTFLSTSLFASYASIYDIKKPFFRFSLENGDYKVRLYNEGTINYLKRDGFKLYLPNYLKKYNLAILRFNSIGYINGYLSIHKRFNNKNILDIDKNNIDYYTTNYATKNLRQLQYLYRGDVIPYNNFTSLAIEGYNITPYIRKYLNKWLYFKFDKSHDKNNKLQELIYSFSMVFDKKLVDAYVKQHYKLLYYSKSRKYDYIYTYVSNLTTTSITKNRTIKKKPIKSSQTKSTLIKELNLQQLLFMKEFGYKPKEPKSVLFVDPELDNFENTLAELTVPNSHLDYIMDYNSFKTKIETLHKEYNSLKKSLQKRELKENSIAFNSCDATNKSLNINCLKNENYLNNYIYFSIKNGVLPSEEVILGYGTGEIFNDVGKYYFEQREYDKSMRYLLKAYVLFENQKTKQEYVAFNLGVLYAAINTKISKQKSIKYFKEAPYKKAYFNLGVAYYLGLGTQQNNKIAFDYFKKASKEGLEIAKKILLK